MKQLIYTRSLVDSYYVSQRYGNPGNPLESPGEVRFSEDILTTYFDLDTLISGCGLTDTEYEIIRDIMDGYLISDIMEERGYCTRSAVTNRLDTAVEKIVAYNNAVWSGVFSKNKN